MNNVLNLTLYRKWFDKIKSGEKKYEFRDIKPYWTKRLEGKTYSEIHFRNGYGKNRPFMCVECLGIEIHKSRYCIKLGKVLEATE